MKGECTYSIMHVDIMDVTQPIALFLPQKKRVEKRRMKNSVTPIFSNKPNFSFL